MHPPTLDQLPALRLERLLRRLHIPWAAFALTVAAAVFLLAAPPSLALGPNKLVEFAVHDGAITAYVLLIWPLSKYLLAKSLAPLSALAGEDPLATAPTFSAREWQLPILLGLLLTGLDNSDTENFLSLDPWLFLLSGFLTYASITWAVYAVFASARQVSHFVSRVVTVRVFDVSPFRPVANWCLSASVMIMTGLSLSVLFLGGDFLIAQNLIVYILASVLGVVVFFAGMWSTHALMAGQKDHELRRVNAELQALHHELLGRVRERDLEAARSLLSASESLTAHKERIAKLPEWPYTVGNLGGLASSFLLPLLFNFLNKLF